MLEYRRFLDAGQTMNTAAPAITDEGPLWSGLRLGDEAVVRTFTEADHPVTATLTPFPDEAGNGAKIDLPCPPAGATYLLKLAGGKIIVKSP